MKLENRLVPKDFTLGDVQNLQSEEWGHQIFTDVQSTLMADAMSKLQISLHFEEYDFCNFDLFRICLALQSHKEEAQDFVTSVYKLIKDKE
jgi:hypothetical protein